MTVLTTSPVNNESTCDCCEIPASPNVLLAQQPLEIPPNLAQKKLEDKSDCSCCMEKRGAVLYSSVSDNPSPAEVKDYIGRMVCCQAPCCQPPGSVSFSRAFTSVSRRFLSQLRRARGKATDAPSCCAEPIVDVGLSEKQVIDYGEPSTEVQTLFMTIGGMDCPSCTPRVERALRKLDQVTDIKVRVILLSSSSSFAEDIH